MALCGERVSRCAALPGESLLRLLCQVVRCEPGEGRDPAPPHSAHPDSAATATVPSQLPTEVPARNMAAAKFTRKEIEARNHRRDAAIIIDNVVYDVTEFMDDHPGGVEVLLDNAGKDASECFHEVGHSEIALEWREKFVIGEVVEEDKWEVKARDSGALQEAEPLTLSGVVSVWGPPVLLAAVAALLYMYLFP